MARIGPPSVAALLQGFQQGTSRKYEIDLANGVLKADDKDDHARAMEALDRLGKLRASMPGQTRQKVASQAALPVGLTLEKAIQNYSEIEAPGLKADTWDGRQRALKSFVDGLRDPKNCGVVLKMLSVGKTVRSLAISECL